MITAAKASVLIASTSCLLEHFPEKWAPVFRTKCDKIKNPEGSPIHLNRKAL
jgi:hypothetical protein